MYPAFPLTCFGRQELKRAAALDAKAMAMDEDRVKAMEKLVALRLAEADAVVDSLETAQKQATAASEEWEVSGCGAVNLMQRPT